MGTPVPSILPMDLWEHLRFLSDCFLHTPSHLPCGKNGSICRMDSEEEQQPLAEHIACLDASDAIVLLLVSKATLHYRGSEVSDNLSRRPETFSFFFGPWPFSGETGRYAFFCTHSAVGIVGVYGIGTETPDFDSRQRFLIFNALLKTDALVECLKAVVLYE